MDDCEASASDCVACPSLRSSRRHRKPRPRNSDYYKRLLASHERRRKEILQNKQAELSSSDESEPPPPFKKSGFPNPKFLRYMPRPSEIVPAIEDGSASDAGFNKQERQIHKRRVEATRILLTSIGPEGIIRPVERWKRNRHGLSKYTPFMGPPTEDAKLPDLRVPLPLLSRFYRGTLLTVHRVGTMKRNAFKREVTENLSPEASALECECFDSSSNSDLDNAEPRVLAKTEPVNVDEYDNSVASPEGDSQREAAKGPSGFSKEAFLEELCVVAGGSGDDLSEEEMKRLQESGVDDDNSSRENEGEGKRKTPAKPKGQNGSKNASDDEVQEISKPEKQSEFDLFCQVLSQNPKYLLEDRKPPPDDEASKVKERDAEEETDTGKREESTALTEFEKEKRVAKMFSNDSSKRPRSVANVFSGKDLKSSKRRKVGEDFENATSVTKRGEHDSRVNLKFALKVMGKMGFTGRLGKKEDGRKDPVLPTRHKFRSGLGSRPAQIQAQGEDDSLLPTKFKGKSVQTGPTSRSTYAEHLPQENRVSEKRFPLNSITRMPERADVYTRRRKESVSEQGTHSRGDVATAGSDYRSSRPGKQAARHLDENDIYETDDEDGGLDNGRRAIIIDMDALIKDSAQRRFDAFEKMLKDASLFLNLRKVLANEARDLCEAELLRLVLGHANVKPHMMDNFKEKLDVAFESLPFPELDMDLVDMLRQYARDVHFGIFHRGSRRRLQYDLKRAGLSESFLQEVCATVKHEERWPYFDTWQDLMSRVGAAPRQCLYLLSDTNVVKCRRDLRPSTGVLAGSCLGAQTAVLEQLEDGIRVRVRGPSQKCRTIQIANSSAYSDRKKLFNGLLKNRMPMLKRRRVLAQYSDDSLWYSAVVQYEGGNNGECWVKFHKFENTDWILDEELVDLCRRDFRKMEKQDFPGLLDSGDVSLEPPF